jgi:hypothetical protein
MVLVWEMELATATQDLQILRAILAPKVILATLLVNVC